MRLRRALRLLEATRLFTMIEENLGVPFKTNLLGVQAHMGRVDLTDGCEVVALCQRGRPKQCVPLLSLPLPSPRPAGFEWIEAYRQWKRGGI